MSIIVEYLEGKLVRCEKLYTREVPSPLYYDEENSFICSGEVFDIDYKELMNIPWVSNPDILNSLKGSYAIAKVDEKKCHFAIDMNGHDSFYYYLKNDHFLMSDNFWDIVKIILPEMEDINSDFVRETIFEGGSQEGRTIIKGINILMPNQCGYYDAISNKLQIENYAQFRYRNSCDNVDMAVAKMDELLLDAMKSIKEKCGDVRYGVGISGGLDSRIISHYAKENNMNIVGFNICVPKPYGIFYARSVKNASQIAKKFNIPYTNVKWRAEKIQEKIKFAVRQKINFTGDAFKYEQEDFPDFDVLLTGGTGLVVGSMMPLEIEEYTKEMLVKSMYQLFASYSATSFYERFLRAINFLFGFKAKRKKSYVKSWLGEQLVGKEYDKIVYNHIEEFVEKRLKNGCSNVDIFVDYFLNVCGWQNRNGAFESLLATKRSYSIYVPFLLKETMSWTPSLLLDRKVLNELIIQKVPEVSNVKSESFFAAPGKRKPDFISKMISMVDFVIRGNGTAIDQYYLKKKKMKYKFMEYVNSNREDWFHKLFNMENTIITAKDIKYEPVRVIVRVWELKALIECLENKEYVNF